MTNTWTARWSNWVVWLEKTNDGWNVKVWRWLLNKPPTARHELASRTNLATDEEAVKWAAGVMKEDGAVVMVLDAPNMTLETMVWASFTPAPQALA